MSSNAWSFGKGAQRSQLGNRKNPGPGAYDYSSLAKSPAFSVSKAGRGSYEKKYKVPGPGAYAYEGPRNGGVTMAQKTNTDTFMTKGGGNNPGPGQYSHSHNAVRPKTAGGTFGIKGSSTLTVRPQTSDKVGPGAYNTGRTEQNGPRDKGFGTSGIYGKTGSKMSVPGPGAYTVDSGAFKENAMRFGDSTRNGKQIKKGAPTPGPGQYIDSSFNSYAKKEIGASMKSRPMSAFAGKSPGPGQYNPDINQVKGVQPGCKFGTSMRDSFKDKDKNPGPGHFGQSLDWDFSKMSKGSTFGPHNKENSQADRSAAMLKNAHVPGPGAYNINERTSGGPKGPQYSMGLKTRIKEDHYQPGPGKYDPQINASRENTNGPKIGTGNRSNITGASWQKKYEPGPGQYDGGSVAPSNSHSYSIGTGQRSNGGARKPKADYTPGPGAYRVPCMVADVPKYIIQNQDQQFKFV